MDEEADRRSELANEYWQGYAQGHKAALEEVRKICDDHVSEASLRRALQKLVEP